MHNKIEINSPCKESWDEMNGSEKTRYCQKCKFNVHNFSEMEQGEIDELLKSDDRVCVRLYVRPDGTYMTKNCRAKVKRNRALMIFGAVALLPLTLLFFKKDIRDNPAIDKMRQVPVIGSMVNYMFPQKLRMMGARCAPRPKPPQTQPTSPNTPLDLIDDAEGDE
jgi:hypothetical protein